MIYSKILGTGSYLPPHILSNQDLEKMVDTTDEWIVQRVGISSRHLVNPGEETTNSMAAAAALTALDAAHIEPQEIDLIIAATASPEYHFPSVACDVQKRLGIKNETPAFDLNAACSGFIYALHTADLFIKTNQAQKALVIGVDTLSALTDWSDRSTCVLFGDGAGAVVLEASSTPGLLHSELHSAGEHFEKLYAKSPLWAHEAGHKIKMSGQEVFKIAVQKLGEMVEKTLQKTGFSQHDLDWLIPHQANVRIIQAVAKRLNLPAEKIALTIGQHGNTSSASIPLALDEYVRKGRIQKGQLLLLEAFGGGLTWGSTLIRY